MNTQTDLIALIEHDLGPGRRSGHNTAWRCPFHDDRNPSLMVTNDYQGRPFWKCFGCGKHGGPLAWLIEYRQMAKGEALDMLNGNRPDLARPGHERRDPPPMQPDYPPGEAWQKRARQLVERAQASLWEGKGREAIPWKSTDPNTGEVTYKHMTPLEWLNARGLQDDTLRTFQIGYIPPKDENDFTQPWQEAGPLWGRQEDEPVKYFPGILIPCAVQTQFWYLKTRRPVYGLKDKLLCVSGSKAKALYLALTLEMVDTGAVIFCEGELDALLLWQEIEFDNLAAVVTLGSASNDLNPATWGFYLLGTQRRFTAYDSDDPGQKGAAKLAWIHAQPLTIPRIKPQDKDLTDFYKSGGDLRSWAMQALAPQEAI